MNYEIDLRLASGIVIPSKYNAMPTSKRLRQSMCFSLDSSMTAFVWDNAIKCRIIFIVANAEQDLLSNRSGSNSIDAQQFNKKVKQTPTQ